MLRVKEVCKEKGITMTELADKMGIAQGNFSKMINGNPTLETIEKVAECLNVNTGELFSSKGEEGNSFICPKCGAKLKLVEE